MAAYVDQPYYGWQHEDLSHQDESQEVSASQMLDHGSISFGRFAVESLSWERRSVFTHNRCQEELEKFKFPGLVAKKKAYFEEYYRNIRAMKALQESQQTELTLDYGGDGSISSHTGEEDEAAAQVESLGDGAPDVVDAISSHTGDKDETAAQLESLGDGASDVVDAHSGEPLTEVSIEREKECSEAFASRITLSDLENVDSSRQNSEELEQENNSSYPLHMQHLDMNITVHDSLLQNIEDTKLHDLSNLDDQSTPREKRKSIANVQPEVSSQMASYPTTSKTNDVEANLSHSMVLEKIKPSARKYKGSLSVPKLKDISTPARNGLKSETKTKSDTVKPSRGPKYPLQKTIVKAGDVGFSKANADKVSGSFKSSSVSSHRPLTEVHSNVTVPRPFSFSNNRRAAISSGIREGAPKSNLKISTKKASSTTHGKDALDVQCSSKRGVTASGMKHEGLENKRCHEERKKSLAPGNQCTSLKGRGPNVPAQMKARSIDLPARSKFCSNGEVGKRIKSAVRDDKQHEDKDEKRVKEVRHAGLKTIGPPAGNLKTATKKIAPSSAGNLLPYGRKPRFGEQSLEGKKPRQEKPRWR